MGNEPRLKKRPIVVGFSVVTAMLFGLHSYAWLVSRDATALLADGYVQVSYEEGRVHHSFVMTMPKAWTPLEAIPEKARMAILVSEDARFYRHPGFDPVEMKNAVAEAVRMGTRPRGASTISQQLAKNLFLSNEYSVGRKVEELAIALQLERELSKDKMLEIYLNTIEYGEGLYGITAACRYYFDKEPADLTPKEAAFLATLLPNPKRYAQDLREKGLSVQTRERIIGILTTLHGLRYLSNEELSRQADAPLTFTRRALALAH